MSKVVVVSICFCLLFCGFIVYAANAFDTTRTPEYQRRMFGDEIVSIDIQVNPDQWKAMMDNALDKDWVAADININGERFSTVGIRPKGNSTLTVEIGPDSGRYSLHFKFNKFVRGQTYYGLDTFCVNSMMGDVTYMKEYISFDIMRYIGVDSPLMNYANVSVNGEDYGFGIILERYDRAFLERVYNTTAGHLYNVKNTPGNNVFGVDNGGSLIYTDDNIKRYSAIFDNAIFNASASDNQRVLAALKNLNTGTDLETFFDVDAILRYLAAHTVVVNIDSYVSNMRQNYYLYEREGKITVLPWDYNLAFGGFRMGDGDAVGVVNFPIDTPVIGVNMEERPLINKLLEVDEYRERYHQYLRQIVEGYFESGLFESTVRALDAKINEYVKNDASTFYSFEQYETSIPIFIELGLLRAESIKGQLDGLIPSTSLGQSASNLAFTDASNIQLDALGSGGGMSITRAVKLDADSENGDPPGDEPAMVGRGFAIPADGSVNMDLIIQAMPIIMEAGGELTDDVKSALEELGLTEEEMEMLISMFTDQSSTNLGPPQPIDRPVNPATGTPQTVHARGSNSVDDADNDNNILMYVFIIGALLILIVGAVIFIVKPKRNVFK